MTGMFSVVFEELYSWCDCDFEILLLATTSVTEQKLEYYCYLLSTLRVGETQYCLLEGRIDFVITTLQARL